MVSKVINNLFVYERADSLGLRLHLRFFELFTVLYSIIYAWQWGFYILRYSDVVLELGMANYIDVSIFFGNNLPLINAALITVCTVVPFIYRKLGWLYLPAIFFLHMQYVTRFSLGEIPHSSNMLGFSLMGLGIGFAFLKDKQKALQFGFGFVIFFIAFGYTTAAFSKMIGTGFTWIDGNHLWLWIAEKTTDQLAEDGVLKYSLIQQLALQSRFIATMILAVGFFTEFFSFLAWFKKLRPWLFTALVGMHIGIYYTMNIWFMSYMIEIIIIGYPLHKLFNWAIDKYNINSLLPESVVKAI